MSARPRIVVLGRAAEGGAKAVTLEELRSTSKVVSLHLVPTQDTKNLVNAQRLALMRPDAILVNTARAALIDMAALPAALDAGRPGFVALDLFDDEPLHFRPSPRQTGERRPHAAPGLRERPGLRRLRSRRRRKPSGLAQSRAIAPATQIGSQPLLLRWYP